MHEDSCIDINCVHADAHEFPKCFKSFHTLFGFALCFVQLNSCRCNHLLDFDLYANSLQSSHCENGSFEVLSLQPPVGCK